MNIDLILNKLQEDYVRISLLRDNTKDEYMYEFLRGKEDYIENLIEWVMLGDDKWNV